MDFWYFTRMPHGFGPPKRPGENWIACAVAQVLGSLRRINAPAWAYKPGCGILLLELYIFAMELVDVGKEEARQLALGAKGVNPMPDGSSAILQHLPDLETEFTQFVAWMDGHFVTGGDAAERACEGEWFMCGYYLSHRALHLTHFLSAPVDADDAEGIEVLRGIAAKTRSAMLPKLHALPGGDGGGGGLGTQCVDLLGELLAVFEFIVLTPSGAAHGSSAAERATDRDTFRQMAALMKAQAPPTDDCHTAVVYLFSKGALETWDQQGGSDAGGR